jgi:hypothetical protein
MEEKEFIPKAKIMVTQEYQNKYDELIPKHHDVFIKNNPDIGKAEYFEHNILLKENKPKF